MAACVDMFKALADPTRLRILNLLRRRAICVCEVVDVLGLGQSKVSRHLATLKHAGLVDSRREGMWVIYFLAPARGGLHARVIEWLSETEHDLRQARQDLETLDRLSACGEACSRQSAPATVAAG